MFCSNCASELPHSPPITCPNCGMAHYANAKPCGGALVACMWIDDYGDTGQVTLNCYFHCRVTGGSERPQPGEVAELAWFAPADLPWDRLAFPDHARLVLEAWLARGA